MEIRCPYCTAFVTDILEATGIFKTRSRCRCNHDIHIVISPGQPVLVTAAPTGATNRNTGSRTAVKDHGKSRPALQR